jgi:hypothetical protein
MKHAWSVGNMSKVDSDSDSNEYPRVVAYYVCINVDDDPCPYIGPYFCLGTVVGLGLDVKNYYGSDRPIKVGDIVKFNVLSGMGINYKGKNLHICQDIKIRHVTLKAISIKDFENEMQEILRNA